MVRPDIVRRRSVALTVRGREAFEALDARSEAQAESLLAPLAGERRRALVEALGLVSHLTDVGTMPREVRLLDVRPGDLGWVVQRHGTIYAGEFGWDADFEGLVADWQEGRDPVRERAWIAEVDGVRAGCVFCCATDDAAVAKLRTLLVEPWARGAFDGAAPPDGDFRANLPRFSGEALESNRILASAVHALAAAKGCTSAQLCLAWLLAQGDDVVPIPGTKRVRWLEENAAAADVEFGPDDEAALRAAIARHRVTGERYTPEGMKGVGA